MALLNKMTKEQMKEVAGNVTKGSGDSKYIFTSGVYPIKILWVELQKAKNSDAKSFVIRYSLDGNEGSLFGPYIENKDGQRNTIGFDKLCELQAVCGINELNTQEAQVATKKETRQAEVIKEFKDKQVIVQVLQEYGKYNGNVTSRLRLVSFFRASDKASINEIIMNKDIGNRYEFITSGDKPRCKEIRYLDGVTEAEAKAYEENKKAQYVSASTTTDTEEITDSNELPF